MPEWIRKGVEHFQQAIDLDPNYALAYSGLSEAYGFLASSTGGQPPHDAYPLAKAATYSVVDDHIGKGRERMIQEVLQKAAKAISAIIINVPDSLFD